MSEYIEVIPGKCLACRRCEAACIAAHHGLTIKEAMKQRDKLVSRVQVVKTEEYKATVRCHQCKTAPCVAMCPTGALQQAENGEIIMRVHFCMACKMCIDVCPYGAITLESIGMPTAHSETMAQQTRKQVAVRCDMCSGWRYKEGKKIAACVEACPAKALAMYGSDGVIIPIPEKPKKDKASKSADA